MISGHEKTGALADARDADAPGACRLYLRVKSRTASCLLTERCVPALRMGNAWRFRSGGTDAWMASDETPDGEDGNADG